MKQIKVRAKEIPEKNKKRNSIEQFDGDFAVFNVFQTLNFFQSFNLSFIFLIVILEYRDEAWLQFKLFLHVL